MKKLLTTTGLMAAALICRSPEELMNSIPEFGPVISRPDSPDDGPDMAKIKAQYHCVFIAKVPDAALGALGGGQHSAAPREQEHQHI